MACGCIAQSYQPGILIACRLIDHAVIKPNALGHLGHFGHAFGIAAPDCLRLVTRDLLGHLGHAKTITEMTESMRLPAKSAGIVRGEFWVI